MTTTAIRQRKPGSLDNCKRPSCSNTGPHRGYCAKHAYAAKTMHRLTKAQPVREHLARLLNSGQNYQQISSMAGLSWSTVQEVVERDREHMRSSTARAILAIKPTDAHYEARRPVWPVARRLQSLRAAGWTNRELGEELGIPETTICSLTTAGKTKTIGLDRYDRIMAAYPEIASRGVLRACHPEISLHHWMVPHGWDDIDNPDETHDLKDGFVWVEGAVVWQLQRLVAHHGTVEIAAEDIDGISVSRVCQILQGRADKCQISTCRAVWRASKFLRDAERRLAHSG